MWKEKSKSAMTLFCQGDEDAAIAQWKEAVESAAPRNNDEIGELAEINYCIGKCYADQKKDANAASYLHKAVEQYTSIDASHNRLGVIKGTLVRVLKNLGKTEDVALLCQDEEDSDIMHWKEALKNATSAKNNDSARIAELNYCIGKTYADQKKDANAAFYLREAIAQYTNIDENHNRLGVIQYTLAGVLKNLGKTEESVTLYQTVKGIEQTPSTGISLRSAIEFLKKQKLARDLKLAELKRLCKLAEINIDGDNNDIEQLLLYYYYDDKHGCDRSDDDRMLISDYTEFTTSGLCDYLNALIAIPNFITVKGSKKFVPYGAVNFITHDGRSIPKACASAVAIVDLFNQELEACGAPMLFRYLYHPGCLMAYLMDDETFETLREQQALNFED